MPATYTIGGSVINLASGQQLTLADNSSESLAINANGAFTFKNSLAANATFSIAVATQPTGQTCTISGGSGKVSANVTDIGVSCATSTFTVSGVVSNLLNGTQVILRDNGSDSLTVGANGSFKFATAIPYGSGYAVTLANQPSRQVCTVSNAASASVTADVTTVAVSCASLPQYAYVVNSSNDNTVSQFTIGADGALTPMSPPTVPTGQFPQNVTVDPSGRYAYVANLMDNTISEFTVGADGALTPDNLALLHEQPIGPWGVTIDPAGQYAYVLNSTNATATNGTIAQYGIGPSGHLQGTTALVATGNTPWWLVISPNGQYAYVTNQGGDTLSEYAIGAGGSLIFLSPATVATGKSPQGMTIDPTSRYVYVANFGDNTVSQYAIDSGGALTPLTPSTVATGNQPGYVAIDSTGQHAYVTNYNAGNAGTVSQYTIGASGALTPTGAQAVATGKGPSLIAFDGTGRYAYVPNIMDNDISQYSVGASGALTPLGNPIVPTGHRPTEIAITY